MICPCTGILAAAHAINVFAEGASFDHISFRWISLVSRVTEWAKRGLDLLFLLSLNYLFLLANRCCLFYFLCDRSYRLAVRRFPCFCNWSIIAIYISMPVSLASKTHRYSAALTWELLLVTICNFNWCWTPWCDTKHNAWVFVKHLILAEIGVAFNKICLAMRCQESFQCAITYSLGTFIDETREWILQFSITVVDCVLKEFERARHAYSMVALNRANECLFVIWCHLYFQVILDCVGKADGAKSFFSNVGCL